MNFLVDKHTMPREKLVELGAEALSDAELLAIFLRVGVRGKSAIELAAEMLTHFGSVSEILKAELHDFSELKGLGLAKYAQLQAASELVKRTINQGFDGQTCFSEPEVVDRFLRANFVCKGHESFAALFLNSKNHLLKFEFLFNGSINSAQVYPRTVAQYCLRYNAAAVIFAHNHPSGDTTPSASDINLTQQLKTTLALIDVKVLDHFVVGHNQTFSMAVNQMI
ncbi:RadC family protein [Marinicella marina]|uniref:RadC family protein n=1 Tax=Marinicella marina TaxID=2996016 RepID=UPI0022608B72|nr:DNA repair protein RadC [Marinicella marina]MDJ1140352.1 DNA repair protein RadC [Marinicella marina]